MQWFLSETSAAVSRIRSQFNASPDTLVQLPRCELLPSHPVVAVALAPESPGMPFKSAQLVGVAVFGTIAWLAAEVSRRSRPATTDERGAAPEQAARPSSVVATRIEDCAGGHPRGLVNTGNTCFLNSVLQCVASLPLLKQYVLAVANEEARTQQGTQFATALLRMLELLSTRADEQLNYRPSQVQQYLLVGTLREVGRQQDAHELLLKLTECLHMGTGEHLRGWRPVDGLESSWPALGGATNHTLENPFGCLVQSSVTCVTCGALSSTHNEWFVDLAAPIPQIQWHNIGRVSLGDCLRQCFSTEAVSMRCTHCDRKVAAAQVAAAAARRADFPTDTSSAAAHSPKGLDRSFMKVCRLRRAPELLCIHLERLVFAGNYVHKREDAVRFPLELDMSPYMGGVEDQMGPQDRGSPHFQLAAVVVHHGSGSNNGHYTAYRRFWDGQERVWYHISDTDVTQVSEEQLLQAQAYLLFYTRRSDVV
eukprot:TRINITY_DN17774_c0_g1_i2.p1 TRINITY_DN17774_c0_g1~~TRINITY_DN17774_c0_g1_i2.p1  ORF type:complete len:480 (+),score=84.83 TRINITY_DN17774_c0_g1_i2:1-1440(+)